MVAITNLVGEVQKQRVERSRELTEAWGGRRSGYLDCQANESGTDFLHQLGIRDNLTVLTSLLQPYFYQIEKRPRFLELATFGAIADVSF